jgi:hypothetical protein
MGKINPSHSNLNPYNSNDIQNKQEQEQNNPNTDANTITSQTEIAVKRVANQTLPNSDNKITSQALENFNQSQSDPKDNPQTYLNNRITSRTENDEKTNEIAKPIITVSSIENSNPKNEIVYKTQFVNSTENVFAKTSPFEKYVQSVLQHGILSGFFADKSKIGITPSNDLSESLPKHVCVNVVFKKGLYDAIYHQAKGALSISLERKNDDLYKTFKKTISKEKELEIRKELNGFPEGLVQMAIQTASEKSFEIPQKSINVLSERAHKSLFFLMNSETIKIFDNGGKVKIFDEVKPHDVTHCREIQITGNIHRDSFETMAFSNSLNFTSTSLGNIKFYRVPSSNKTKIYYNYKIGNQSRSVAVEIIYPNYEKAILEYFHKKQNNNNNNNDNNNNEDDDNLKYIITHLSRGPS